MRVMKGHSTIMDITMELKCLFHTHTTRTCYADVIASIAHIQCRFCLCMDWMGNGASNYTCQIIESVHQTNTPAHVM